MSGNGCKFAGLFSYLQHFQSQFFKLMWIDFLVWKCLKYFIEMQINPQACRKIDFENIFEKFGGVQETVWK